MKKVAISAKRTVRRLLKGESLSVVERQYRLARGRLVNARYGFPGRGLRVVMITGTNGKTTTAHFLFSILRQAGLNVGLLSTAEFRFNDEVRANDTNLTSMEPGQTRATLAEFKKRGVDFVILEATSQALDQYRLHGVACELAIFTNLTHEHLDYHKTMAKYAAAKAKLWDLRPRLSIINRDDQWADYFMQQVRSGRLLSYGQNKQKTAKANQPQSSVAVETDVYLTDYRVQAGRGRFKLHLPDGASVIDSALVGRYNAYNALAAATAAYGLGIQGSQIEDGLEALKSIPGRLELVELQKAFRVFVDYAHTSDGLEKALGAGRDLVTGRGRLWLVFGSCGDRDKTDRPLKGKIAASLADQIVLTDEEAYGEDPAVIAQEVRSGIIQVSGGLQKLHLELDRRKAIAYALGRAKKDDIILITGLGHEQFRIINGVKTPWHEPTVVREIIEKNKF